jgi:predicted RecA/RadA family phage recombinase
MATNKVQDGKQIEMAVQSGVVAGDPEMVGGIGGVALTSRNADGQAVLALEGVFDLSVKGVNDAGNSAVAIGDAIYWVTGDTPKLSKKSTAGKLFGYALETVDSAATATINVRLVGTAGPDVGVLGSAHIVDAVTLTDSSGLTASHDDTVAAVTNTTSLTDNGGGTADGTVASQAAPVTITDSTGLHATHGDTLNVAGTPSCAGGATPTATQVDTAIVTAITPLLQNESSLGQKLMELVTLATTAQNNLKEVTTELATQRTLNGVLAQNVCDITQKLIEVITKQASQNLALEKAGILADS